MDLLVLLLLGCVRDECLVVCDVEVLVEVEVGLDMEEEEECCECDCEFPLLLDLWLLEEVESCFSLWERKRNLNPLYQ